MNTKDIFDAFSDDDDDDAMPTRTKRPGNTLMQTNLKQARADDEMPVVADDFDQSVDKKYELEKDGLIPNKEKDELVVSHQVRHQVAIPPNYNYIPISQHVPPEKPARTYPFTLDPFQKTAISSIERGESVLVAAHTSAGKTVVAEYAIASCLRDKQRVIYTSPIKALSNQKYRELLAEFGDVGLMTGDVSINTTASCMVMTTEILRSMLYRGSDMMREVAWVVFDEIHYMRDSERGVVWEEALIMLPDKVHSVFLSATILNAMQFAEWICKLHKQPCHVVYTDYRPTPLQHYLFPAHGEGIYLVVDEKGKFREENFQKAISAVSDGKKQVQGPSDLSKVVQMIMKKNYHPVIVFSFSKKKCEGNAHELSKMDFNSEAEKELIQSVFENAVLALSEDDRNLPQIVHILPLLKRGIGIHHSGLLPILKEVIEILFQEGLIKVLFATETFSIGLNMPAKTVMFTDVRKFDGKTQRWLGSGEYIQMSGRAGRRGIDARGVVILMIGEKMEPDVAKTMVKGVPDPLNSAFHLTYPMILNLLRVEGITPEQMLSSSFYQFQNAARLPVVKREILQFEKERDGILIENEKEIGEFYELKQQLLIYLNDRREVLNHPTYALPFIQPGRLIRIKKGDVDFGWGITINFQKTFKKQKGGDLAAISKQGPVYVVDVLLNCAVGCETTKSRIEPSPDGKIGDVVIVPCSISDIDGLSTIRVNVPRDIREASSRKALFGILGDVRRKFPEGIPILDPIEDMGIKDEAFKKLVHKIKILEGKISDNPLKKDPQMEEKYQVFDGKMQLEKKIKDLNSELSKTETLLHLDELKNRRRLLRRMGYITASNVIETKGRVACEITCGDSLVLTEMIFNGVFNELSVEQSIALASCFTCDERTNEVSQVRRELQEPLKTLKDCAKQVAIISNECKIEIDIKEYVDSFRGEMMDVIYMWAQGATFLEITKVSSFFEGSIIRVLRRLNELLQELQNAAKSIGNTDLEEKFKQGSEKIKRDIVFAASLYL